jgi:hypothetical protein
LELAWSSKPMPNRFLPLLVSGCVAASCLATFGGAWAWTPNGAPVGPADTTQHTPVIARDGAGGAFVVWVDWRTGPNTRTFIQHLLSDGALSSGWPAEGRMLSGAGERDHPFAIPDGSGGVYVADDGTQRYATGGLGRVAVYHVAADGSAAGGAPAAGNAITGDPSGTPGGVHGDYLPALASDGSGGAFLAWTFRDRFADNAKAMRLHPGLTNAAGWSGFGEYARRGMFTIGQEPVAACADGAGGVFVVWPDYRGSVMWVARFAAGGSVMPGWPARVSPNTSSQSAPGVVPDGSGGAFVTWQDLRDGVATHPYAQHLDANGSPAPGWPADGLALSSAPAEAGIVRATNFDAAFLALSSIVEDGAGGAYVAWTDYRSGPGDIYLQRLAPGSIAAGWPALGLAVGAASGNDARPTLAADGAGGAFVAWEDRRTGLDADVRVQHVRPNGSTAAGWPVNGSAVCEAPGDQLQPVVVASDADHAIVAWTDHRGAQANVYAGLAVPDLVTPVASSLVSGEASPGLARLVWLVSLPAGRETNVYRSRAGGWSRVATAPVDDAGRVSYEDRGVAAGRVGYRLGWIEAGAEEYSPPAWLDIPDAPRLSLEGAQPNPTEGSLVIAFSLPSSQPASLAVLDIAGRQRIEREVGGLGPGRHVVDLGRSDLGPGIYVIRLVQGGTAVTVRASLRR